MKRAMTERSSAYSNQKPGTLCPLSLLRCLPSGVIHARNKTLGEFLKRRENGRD